MPKLIRVKDSTTVLVLTVLISIHYSFEHYLGWSKIIKRHRYHSHTANVSGFQKKAGVQKRQHLSEDVLTPQEPTADGHNYYQSLAHMLPARLVIIVYCHPYCAFSTP